ncbi:MAG: hypothetical protein J07HQW1_02154 [Haloquadratum walsbyi J07HQW1]|uniref:Uncharacterized protein n=1 Tax=Haloquadratum walsbyi J07HQW1 TaxID=1238424 RepID=U1MQ31_9EURY|nr:MAG: hypothetical protein J07HQW1_02154 [Haloquadratum walsbyi J07HQW1]
MIIPAKVLRRIERESDSDSDDLPLMTLAEVFDHDLTTERINENVIRIIEIDKSRQG